MLITNNNSLKTLVATTGTDNNPHAAASVIAKESDADQADPGNSVSVFARQLSAAAVRAQSRDASLDSIALGRKALRILSELTASTSQSEQANDPVGLASVAGNAAHTLSHSFRGLPRDQLALLTYDEGGEFSMAERTAAKEEASRQEQLWRQNATQGALIEHNTTGKMSAFFNRALTHFESLAPIEQSQYPADYAADLQSRIESSSGSEISQGNARSDEPLELIQRLLPAVAFTRTSGSSESPTVVRMSQPEVPVLPNSSNDGRGRQIMLERLFGGHEPRVYSGEEGMRMENMSRSDYLFLTRQDRELIADIYSAVDGQDVDLDHVDHLASEIGDYRRHDSGRGMHNFNNGTCFNSEGWQVRVDFIEKDAATASRILKGSAINSTRFDQGFLRYILDPGYGALSNTSDLGFLEHMVIQFSTDAEKAAPMAERFSKRVPVVINDNCVITASTEVRIPNFKPSFIYEDGEWRLTDKGKAGELNKADITEEPERQVVGLIRFQTGLDILRYWPVDPRREVDQEWLKMLWARLKQG